MVANYRKVTNGFFQDFKDAVEKHLMNHYMNRNIAGYILLAADIYQAPRFELFLSAAKPSDLGTLGVVLLLLVVVGGGGDHFWNLPMYSF